MDALAAGRHPNSRTYLSFYSSELKGIVTDPALMVLHMDDHLVHRGHGVFDTAVISEVRRQRRAPSSAGHHSHTGVLAGDCAPARPGS
jgi:hypothetical protein